MRKVSLNEVTRREEIERQDAKRESRRQLRESAGPLLENEAELAEADPADTEPLDEVEEDEEDDRPDLLLRESARIMADMVELGADVQLLAKQFSLLDREAANGMVQ